MTAMISAMIAMVRVFMRTSPLVCGRSWRRPTSPQLSRHAGHDREPGSRSLSPGFVQRGVAPLPRVCARGLVAAEGSRLS